MSQGDDAATQELSPSHFHSYIHKSRSARQLEGDDGHEYDYSHEQQGQETQFTLHEGDEGHIDLISSFEQRLSDPNDLDSDPAAGGDFSPTQSERALSHFPESQRFKTPATAGKKRRYNGDLIDTPYIPRNPLHQQNIQSNGHVMALSQAFAATQADTSPFVQNGLPDLQSDRPSPNIELQPRPITATTSSPLRMLPEFTRASTEPASRYISVKQSQAEREKQAEIQRQQDLADYVDDIDDGLVDERTQSIRARWRGGIEQRVRSTLRQMSSPSKRAKRGHSATKSSPIRASTHRPPSQILSANRPDNTFESSPPNVDEVELDNETEVETEQEDNVDIAVTRSSQGLVAMDAEDKENFSETGSQVPETTARLHQIINGFPSHVQDSPSIRRSHRYTISSRPVLDSSGPIAVANSQPSQTQEQRQAFSNSPNLTASEGVDFVPQSPTASPQRTLETRQRMSLDPSERGDDATTPVNKGPSVAEVVPSVDELLGKDMADEVSRNLRSTIPETSSNEQDIQNNPTQIEGRQNDSKSSTHIHFETAVSHFPAPTSEKSYANEVGLSSPPIITTPPGRKRKRLTEIATEPSPQKSDSQSSFNASQALRFDTEFQVGPDIGTSQLLLDKLSQKRKSVVICSSRESQKENEAFHLGTGEPSQPPTSHDLATALTTGTNGLESNQKPAQQRATYSRRDRKPSSKSLSALRESAGIKPRTSPSTKWEIEVSPPQTAIPVMKPPKSSPALVGESHSASKSKQKVQKRVKLANKDEASSPLATTLTDIEPSHSPELASAGDVRQRQTASPLIVDPIIAPNMVFACFNGKTRAYYPALCLGISGGGGRRLSVQWEGFAPDDIDEHGVRSLDLRVGDLVKVDYKGFPKVSYVVRGFKDKIGQEIPEADLPLITDVRGYKTVVVAPKQRKSLPADMSTDSVKEIPFSAIYLDSNMWGQMKDRSYEFKLTTDDGYLSHFITPVGKVSTPSTPTSRSRRTNTTGNSLVPPTKKPSSTSSALFVNMTFAISYHESRKHVLEDLVDLVESNGGHVLKDSFLDLLEPDSFNLKGRFASYNFAALLTDCHSRKPKYLQALALGIPCLSGRWIDACVKAGQLVDWTHYLLPAGESSELDGATKSRVLPYATNSTSFTVKEMIDSRPNMLAGVRAIVVMGKGKTDAKRDQYLFFIQALGAETVEVESNLNSAKDILQSTSKDNHDQSLFVLLVVDEQDVDNARRMILSDTASKSKRRGRSTNGSIPSKEEHVMVIGNEAIVQSLILGKLLIQ